MKGPPYFWRQLRRLNHTVLLMLMRPPNSRSRSSFSGAFTPKTLWIARAHLWHMVTSAPLVPDPFPPYFLDAAAQTPPHRVASADAKTQLPLTEFFLGCIHSKDPLDRSVPPPAHGFAHSASLPQPSDIATINSLSSTSNSSGPHACTQVSRARLHSAPPQPPGLEDQAPLISHHGIPVKAAPVRPHLLHPPQFRPCSHM